MVDSAVFRWATAVLAIVGVGVLMGMDIETRLRDPSRAEALFMANYALVWLLALECCARLLALPQQDAASPYHSPVLEYIDAGITASALLAETVAMAIPAQRRLEIPAGWTPGNMLLSFVRALRVFHLIRAHRDSIVYLRQIGRILDFVGIFLFLYIAITYAFAVTGMELFGTEVVDPVGQEKLTEQHAAMDTLFKSLLILFQLSTQNNWNEVNAIHERASTPYVWWFFGTYLFLISIIFQDILTGVMMDAFEHMHSADDDGQDGEDGESGERSTDSAALTRFDRWFLVHGSDISVEESREAFGRHATDLHRVFKRAHNVHLLKSKLREAQAQPHAAQAPAPSGGRGGRDATSEATSRAETDSRIAMPASGEKAGVGITGTPMQSRV